MCAFQRKPFTSHCTVNVTNVDHNHDICHVCPDDIIVYNSSYMDKIIMM